MAANTELDTRRQFTEAVLSGVSAGVLSAWTQKGGSIYQTGSASELLGMDLDEKINEKLADTIPEFADLLALSTLRPDRLQQSEVTIKKGLAQKTFFSTCDC